VDPLFCDREVFADFFTRYYTDYEPEHCIVAVDDGRVVGYLIACLDYRNYPTCQALITLSTIPRIFTRVILGRYSVQSIRFLGWFLTRAYAETPKQPPRSAHFHINILPRWRAGVAARRLMFPFFKKLPEWGAQRVYGQIQIYGDRRPVKLFERYGFNLYDQKRVSKFDAFGKKGVYVATFVHEFGEKG
jgi:hypothetical protein